MVLTTFSTTEIERKSDKRSKITFEIPTELNNVLFHDEAVVALQSK